MEREQLGVVVGAAEALDPLRRRAVLLRALGAGDLAVGDVAQQHVGERPLALALDRGAALPGQEALALEGVQERRRPPAPSRRSAPVQKTLPTTAASWRSDFSLGREPVEAGGDDALQRLGEREVLRRAALEVELRELLGVERVALRPLEQRLLGLGREQRALEDVRDEDSGLLLRERGEADRRGVELAAAPAGPPLEELRPRAADDEERDAAQPVDELVDEVEQALVGPVQVLEHEHERPLLGERLEEAPPGGEGLSAAVAAEAGVRLESDQRAEVRLDPARIARVVDSVLDGDVQLLGRFRLACRARGCRPAP